MYNIYTGAFAGADVYVAVECPPRISIYGVLVLFVIPHWHGIRLLAVSLALRLRLYTAQNLNNY